MYLPRTKTGRHQAVCISDPAVASLLVAWKEAVLEVAGPGARLFGTPAELRGALARALSALDGGVLESRGLHFTWHSLRHGGASRAYLAGMEMSDILLRGRWAAESSGRHYVQGGRQLLLSQALPPTVTEVARRLLVAGGVDPGKHAGDALGAVDVGALGLEHGHDATAEQIYLPETLQARCTTGGYDDAPSRGRSCDFSGGC